MTQDALQALRRGDLAGARELRLPAGVGSFPREIFGLADTLEVLDLSHGGLTSLPADMGRLRKLHVLFCSGNRFERLPPSLGDCPALSQIGCRGAGLREISGEALPRPLRWLTLTDNAIERLPAALGERPLLQKLMLAGNRLRDLPAGLANADNLELIRLAANAFDTLPPWLLALPRLAWLGWAGNPVDGGVLPAEVDVVPWHHLEPGRLIGEGASGRVYGTTWHRPGAAAGRRVALKLFKGAMTSDGLPEREMAACLASGEHPGLTGALGRLTEHPEGLQGLVMPLLPEHWRVLAGPPSLASCTRDVYDPLLRLRPEAALRILRSAGAAAAHLHARGVLHGDLYAHNILWDGGAGAAVLSDFGAASVLPQDGAREALQRIEVRAFGVLLDEVLSRCDDEPETVELRRNCLDPDPLARPSMRHVCAVLDKLRPA